MLDHGSTIFLTFVGRPEVSARYVVAQVALGSGLKNDSAKGVVGFLIHPSHLVVLAPPCDVVAPIHSATERACWCMCISIPVRKLGAPKDSKAVAVYIVSHSVFQGLVDAVVQVGLDQGCNALPGPVVDAVLVCLA